MMIRCMGRVIFFIPGRSSFPSHSDRVVILKSGDSIVVISSEVMDVDSTENESDVVESGLVVVTSLVVVNGIVLVNGIVVSCVSIDVVGHSEDVTVVCVFGLDLKLSSLEALVKKATDVGIITIVNSMANVTKAQQHLLLQMR